MADILVLFASKSDEETYKNILNILDHNNISYTFKLASAHKTPQDVEDIVEAGNFKIVISGAGLAAALPGVVAAKSLKPVIGVPCKGNYKGLDALLSIIQMPPGIPVLSTGAFKGDVAANGAVQMIKGLKKIVLIGDNNERAYKKAEDTLKELEIIHTHSTQIIDDAINIVFTKFDEPVGKNENLIIYCPILPNEEDKPEAALNLLKHSNHGLWVGLNNGVNAAVAAVEILGLTENCEQKLIDYRKKLGDKVRAANNPI
jgi:5-(carboxyamino)imidazole ribonucleotide mutase